MERKILIEIEELDFMDLVNSEEKEELKSTVTEAIRLRVFGLFVSEMKKIVRERYNLLRVHLIISPLTFAYGNRCENENEKIL